MQTTLILAALYNIIGGVSILFLFRLIAPLIHFNDFGPGMFRMFVGGTAVLFGAAYIAVRLDYQRNRPLLVCGTVLKYWAFAISLFGFLTSSLSLQVLLLFGIGSDFRSAIHSLLTAATGGKINRILHGARAPQMTVRAAVRMSRSRSRRRQLHHAGGWPRRRDRVNGIRIFAAAASGRRGANGRGCDGAAWEERILPFSRSKTHFAVET